MIFFFNVKESLAVNTVSGKAGVRYYLHASCKLRILLPGAGTFHAAAGTSQRFDKYQVVEIAHVYFRKDFFYIVNPGKRHASDVGSTRKSLYRLDHSAFYRINRALFGAGGNESCACFGNQAVEIDIFKLEPLT